MLIPLSWIKKYVPLKMSAREVAHRLTMAGTEIGTVKEIGNGWDTDKILVGHVIAVEPHPNADRLTIPTIDLGQGEHVTVVCGAPNLETGQKIAFAKEGALLYNHRSGGKEALKSTKIRGVPSSGMICSEKELGLSDDHSGILVLPDTAETGTPLVEEFGDFIFDADITPNRPDCLSIIGIAREIAAITGETIAEPPSTYLEVGPHISEKVNVHLEDPDLCPRYTAGLLSGLTIGPSPKWLSTNLEKAGIRSINNVVDVTNYVMLEYGQPMHAFDFDTLSGKTVFVRKAVEGEQLAALDEQTYELHSPMLIIADSKGPVGLAGIIGGVNNSVTEKTSSVLLESANFNHTNTYLTRTKSGIATDASYRFERGIRPELAPIALRRAISLILDICGGEASEGIIDVYPRQSAPETIDFNLFRIKQILGIELDRVTLDQLLVSLGFGIKEKNDDGKIVLTAPYWRTDIAIEDDVVEEIARIRGYDSIPTTMISTPIPHHSPKPLRELRESVRDTLAGLGMQEVISYPITNLRTLSDVNPSLSNAPLQIANPMNNDMRFLRTSLRGSLLRTMSDNRRISQEDGIRLFEISRIYLPQDSGKNGGLPEEKETVIGLLSGPRFPSSWLTDGPDMGFFDAKGVLESAFAHLYSNEASYKSTEDPSLHPGKSAQIVFDGRKVGVVGEFHPSVVRKFDLDDRPVAMFEIDLESLQVAVDHHYKKFEPTSHFPESERDLALVVDTEIPSDRIQEIVGRNKLVKYSTPFDIYTGEGIPNGKKSIAFKIIFQSNRATLTAERIEGAQSEILQDLRDEIGADIRS